MLEGWAEGSDDLNVFRSLADGYYKELLKEITCPVLLLQGNPELGGVITDGEVEHTLSILPEAYHAYIEGVGHNLGLYYWETAPLQRAMNTLLESLIRGE